MWKALAVVILAALLSVTPGCVADVDDDKTPSVEVDWEKVLRVSQTTTTLQVVVNPLLRREFPVSKQIYKSLSELNADYVRYVPWYVSPFMYFERWCIRISKAGEGGGGG